MLAAAIARLELAKNTIDCADGGKTASSGAAGLNDAQHPLDRNPRSVRELGIDSDLMHAVAQ